MSDQNKPQNPPSSSLPRHRHLTAYVALVECGVYLEYSIDGVYRCQSGMAVVHPRFHSHGNRFYSDQVQLKNIVVGLPLEYQALSLSPRHFRGAKHCLSPGDLASLVLTEGRAVSPEQPCSLVREMTESLRSDPQQRIADLAESKGVSPEHAARKFRHLTGLGPAAFRTELRLRHALKELQEGQAASVVAHQWGFSDQSHLCRAVKAATGSTISSLRTSDLFKTTRLAA